MKLLEYIDTIIKLEPDTILNAAKLVFIHMILNVDPSGVWHVDKENYLNSFAIPYNREWMDKNLGFMIQYLDDNRILIPSYLKYKYCGQLNNIDNPKYNPLNKLRAAISVNGLKFDSKLSVLIPHSTVEPTVELSTISSKVGIRATKEIKRA